MANIEAIVGKLTTDETIELVKRGLEVLPQSDAWTIVKEFILENEDIKAEVQVMFDPDE